MRVSQDELNGLCRRAFAGVGLAVGDCEDAADMVVWAEQHGLDGLERLRDGLDGLAAGANTRLRWWFEGPAAAVIDAAGRSVLTCGGLAADLACAEGHRQGCATVKIQHCRDRSFLLGYCPRCARRGMSLVATWQRREGSAVTRSIASFRAFEQRPALVRYSLAEAGDAPARDQTITLAVAPDFAALQPLVTRPEGAALGHTVSPDEFESRFSHVSAQGMEVDDAIWTRLKELAGRTLVEDSEESRRHGAGEHAV